MDDLHACPAIGCSHRLPFEILACNYHWLALPPELRRRISRAWRGGDLVAYVAARREAGAFLNGTPRP